jgi:hypothetical protein
MKVQMETKKRKEHLGRILRLVQNCSTTFEEANNVERESRYRSMRMNPATF